MTTQASLDALLEAAERVQKGLPLPPALDYACNYAAFWDGTMLTLTPAYDLRPQKRTQRWTQGRTQGRTGGRTGGEAAQAMLIHGQGRHYGLQGIKRPRQIVFI